MRILLIQSTTEVMVKNNVTSHRIKEKRKYQRVKY